MPNNPAGVPRADGWHFVKPYGGSEWMIAWLRRINQGHAGIKEYWIVGKDIHECTILVNEIGPRIPSPDERTPDTAPEPEPCIHACNFGDVHMSEDGKLSFDCMHCHKVIETPYYFRTSGAAKQPEPPVSAQELPACAAIQLADGVLIAGGRHDVCIKSAVKLNVSRSEIGLAVQGFMTTKGRFVDREEGWALAIAAGMTTERRGAKILTSEDLY